MAATPQRQMKSPGGMSIAGRATRPRPLGGMPGGVKQPMPRNVLPGGGGFKQPGGDMMWAGGSPNFNESNGTYSQPFIPRNGQYPGMQKPMGGMLRSPGQAYTGDAPRLQLPQRTPMPQMPGGGMMQGGGRMPSSRSQQPQMGGMQRQVDPAIQQAMMRMLMQRFGMGGGGQMQAY